MMRDRSVSVWRRLGWRLEAAGYDLAYALTRALPIDAVSALGAAVVGTLGPLTRKHRIVLRNLELAFPQMSEAERRAIAREFWRVVGRTFAEFPQMDRIAADPGRVEVEGLERLQQIAARGEPAVLVSGHLSNWEAMMVAIVRSGLTSRVSYRPANNPYTDARIIEGRRRYGVELFAAKGAQGARGLIAALKRGEAVAMLNDQRDDAGIEAPFFGHVVKTAPGPSRFALGFGGRLVPMSVVRGKGARFTVTIHEPIVLERSGDREADLKAAVAAVNAFIEARIRARPAEWLWAHRRWPMELYGTLARRR
jgi:KDO2-lipid IV(A) lauroyltransferase